MPAISSPMPTHEWHERDDDDVLRYVRAELFGKRWTLRARTESESEWTELSPPPLDDLHELRDVLWRKYQRGRVPHQQVIALDRLIEKRQAEE